MMITTLANIDDQFDHLPVNRKFSRQKPLESTTRETIAVLLSDGETLKDYD